MLVTRKVYSMIKSFFSTLLAFVLAVSLALTQFSPAYADVNLPAEINQQFTPLQIDAGGISVLRITIFNPNSHTLTNVSFTDDLLLEQLGLRVADLPNVHMSPSCGAASFSPLAGATSLSFSNGNVPAEATVPGECWVEVNITSTTPGNLINTIKKNALSATGSGGVTIHNTSPASATITVIAVDPPSMSKTFAPNTIYVGQTSQLTIRINNNDPDTNLTDVSFTDTLPTNVILATPVSLLATGCGATPTVIAGGTTIVLSGGTITPTTDCVITVNVTGASGIYTNSIPEGPVTPLNPNSLHTQQGVTNDNDVDADLNIQPVGVSKAFSDASIVAGNTTTLTIILTNPTGPTGADYTGVGISDTLPAGLTFSGLPPTPTTCPGGSVVIGTTTVTNDTITLTNGTIPFTAPGTCTITATVKADLTASGTLTNTIPVNALNVTSPAVKNNIPASDDLTVTPALTGTKSYTAPYAIALDGTNAVTIELFNNSSTPFTNVYFTDTLPANLTVSGTPISPQCGGDITSTATSVTLVNGSGGTIPANGSCTIAFDVTSSTPGSGTTYENTIPVNDIHACTAAAECVGNSSAITTGTDLTVVNATKLPVNVSKSFSPASITPGQTSRLTITLTAPLDIGINGIGVTDNLPTGVTVAPTPNAATTCPGGTARITATAGSGVITFLDLTTDSLLAAGTSCTIAVNVTATPGIYPNTIGTKTITTFQSRTNELNAANATLTVTSMTMKKAFYPTTVQADGKSTLTITLQNTSTSPLDIVTLTDKLPGTLTDGLVIASVPTTTCPSSTPSGVVDSQTIGLSGGTVPAQVGSVPGICTITVDVQGKGSAGDHTNTIPVSNVTATDGTTLRTVNPLAPASAILTIKNMKIGIVKGFDPVLVYGGATSTLTVKLINPNSVPLTGIAFTDDLDYFYASETPPANVSGMKLANPPAFNTGTCGGILTGTAGTASFSFSGGVLQPNSDCSLTLKVIMIQNGSRTNKIPIGAVTTFNGVKSDQPIQASLTNLPGVGVTKSFSPNPVAVGQVSKLTITITNTSTVPVVNMGLLDNFPTLPTGLAIASPSNATNNCKDDGTAAPLIASAGFNVIHMTGGGLAPNGSGHYTCTIEVSVVASSTGAFVNTIPLGAVTANDGITNKNSATDTLVVGALFSLGNRVWFDTNNNSLRDTTEVGVDGVTVQLYSADASGNPTVLRGTQVTSGGGYYRFDQLETGKYVVVIPKDNFTDVGPGDVALTNPLAGYLSSGTTIDANGAISDSTSNNPDDNIDNDDNGITKTSGTFIGGVISNAITLGPNADEPTNDADMPIANPFGESPDNQSNRTLDFGFYKTQLGDLIYRDINQNGTNDGGDLPLSGAMVKLFASNGTTEINVGPDGILGTADDALGGVTTVANGLYQFSGLPAGSYIVKVLPTGYPSTVDTFNSADTLNPNTNANNNDNGVGTTGGTLSSNVVTLTPGNVGALSNNTVDDATGTTYNPTVDFGYITSLGKKIIPPDDAIHTTGTNVTIGEIITYEVSMVIPAAGLNNVQLVDTPQAGLAFVDCINIDLPAGVTSANLTAGACNTKDGTTAGTSNPLITSNGGVATFDFGNITNSTGSSQTIKVQYSVIVLDILANQGGGILTNNVTWTWTGGTLTTSAPEVKIVEPKMTMDKNATPTSAAVGDIITFTIDIAHSAQSSADAFDVVVTDQIPTGLALVTSSVNVTGTTTLTSSIYDPVTNILRLIWNGFGLGQTARVTFQASYLGPPPVVNSANVEWTTLEIDPAGTPPVPQQRSTYNTASTERWYDPGSLVNIYSVKSSVTINSINLPGSGDKDRHGTGVRQLPATGFAPGVVTILPEQPADKVYFDTGGVWLEIPRLSINTSIVGIPQDDDGTWDVSWLWEQAGWLQGTAYPTWNGNSAITGHVYLPNGKPGPFVDINKLAYGDMIIVHANGEKYTYEVRENKTVKPSDTSVLKHEDKAWLTLLTCLGYNESNNTYTSRVAIRAVLMTIEEDKTSIPNKDR
jgi:LPXTG-site transpeptidase (sortase) family protein